MKKALHGDIEEFFTFREGKLHRFQVGDIDWLLAAANDAPHFEVKTVRGMKITHRNGVPVSEVFPDDVFCAWVMKFMDWFIACDVTEDLIDELVEEAPDFLEAYLDGRKWVSDKYYDGDMSKLSPLSSKIQSLVNPPI